MVEIKDMKEPYPTIDLLISPDMDGNVSDQEKISVVKCLRDKGLADSEIIFLWCFVGRNKANISSENQLFKEIRRTLKANKDIFRQLRKCSGKLPFSTRTEKLHELIISLMKKKVIVKDANIKGDTKQRRWSTFQFNSPYISILHEETEKIIRDSIKFVIPMIIDYKESWYYMVK